MLRFKVVAIDVNTNELSLLFRGRIIRFRPNSPAFYFNIGQIIRVPNKGGI